MYDKSKLDEDIIASDSELMNKEDKENINNKLNDPKLMSPNEIIENKGNKDNFIAGICNLLSTFLWALSVIFHKYTFINHNNFGPLNQLFFKYLAATFISILFVNKYYSKEQIEGLITYCKINRFIITIRCLSGWFAGLSAVLAVRFISPTVLGCVNTFIPLTTSLVTNYINSNHEINKKDFLIFMVCIVCSLIINFVNYNLTVSSINNENSNNTNNSSSILSAFIGILFSFSFLIASALRNVSQKLIKDLDIYLAVMTLYIACTIGFFVCLILFESISADFKSIFSMMCLGSFEFFCLLLNVYAINKGDVNFIQQISYSFLPFVCILSYIFTGEIFNTTKVLLILTILTINIYQTYQSFVKS